MRIHLHDFAGHPFQAQLSRALCAAGHEVEHGFAAQYRSGKGSLSVRPADPAGLSFTPFATVRPFVKYGLTERLRYEREYARQLTRHLVRTRPDVTVLTNVPLLIMHSVHGRLTAEGLPWVLWHQDLMSVAMARELRARLPSPLAGILSRELKRRERACVIGARAVVAIGPAFLDEYQNWGIRRDDLFQVPNWAPLDEVFPVSRQNDWAARHGLAVDRLRLIYSGTLGRKHNPLLLVQLLRQCEARNIDVDLTVVSEGDGADVLRSELDGEPHARVLPFQPMAELGELLSASDVLVAILEPAAAGFSIPSKVLTYLAAGRPVLGLMPKDNPATQDIIAAGGFADEPTESGVLRAASWLRDVSRSPGELSRIAARSRSVAEARFDIKVIAGRFESILDSSRRTDPARLTVGGGGQRP